MQFSTLRSFVVMTFYLFLFYLVLLFSYRLVFHPLRRYPGPFLAKLTDAYGGFHAVRKRFHLITYDAHQKFGKVIRLGPNRLVFNSAEALHDIYQNPRVNKAEVYKLSRMIPLPSTFDTLDLDDHRRKRKIISQPISERRLRTFEPTMIEQVDNFINQLHNASSEAEPINMTDWCRNLAGDIIGQLAFGYPLKLLTEDTNRWLLPGLLMVTYRVNVLMQFPLLQSIDPLIKFLGRKIRRRYITVAETMIKSRVALDKDAKHDFYSVVIDHLKTGSSLKDSELWIEGFLYISAGGNTTSATMSSMFFYLSRYPECYQKLAREIRDNFQSADEITWSTKLRGCSYLRACINEALRIATPNSTILWRE
ncbi:putative cytochrome p450 protein [Paramyrothecium foliicola]|nr:putative cytochrome p450 protein [Paramyrothecium foliicola]